MKNFSLVFLFFSCLKTVCQPGEFFPNFTPYSEAPIIKFGDQLRGAPWNDPTVLKEGQEYIMYTSGVEGGLNHPDDTIGIYRWTSADGYDWALNPSTPVLKAKAGTYYSSGVETPSVVFFKDEYHMYNTVYTQNTPFDFKISHSVSSDGVAWTIDPSFILEPTPEKEWMSTITAEPGVVVKEDTLLLFFAAGEASGFLNIGLARSIDGRSFIDTALAVSLPTDVYPLVENYAGLSTPSPALVGDTVYLFTDVAQVVFETNFMQVALHQFKSVDLSHWFYDEAPIHRREDFAWTNGNLNAEIRSITPLVDGDRLRIWYAGHKISNIDTETNDTTNFVFFNGDELFVNEGLWGIGTSEYKFPDPQKPLSAETGIIKLDFYQNQGTIKTEFQDQSHLAVYTLDGRILLQKDFVRAVDFAVQYEGVIVLKVETTEGLFTKKLVVTRSY
ncbi:MAG: hypothetical protein AAF616_10295 [Bacteroidota bacterium]